MLGPGHVPASRQLSRAECLALLQLANVGRVGLSIAALPVVLPVRYALIDDDLLFRTPVGSRLNAAAAGAVVAFQVDTYAFDSLADSAGWSVLVQGPARQLTSPEEIVRVEGLPLERWGVDAGEGRFVRIETAFVSGREFGGRAPS
jgi:nitroimidazol reductase NimA-like FMN-containing flavoprotein (pyridoxamine 5'-phosphate oxidase superfamily)